MIMKIFKYLVGEFILILRDLKLLEVLDLSFFYNFQGYNLFLLINTIIYFYFCPFNISSPNLLFNSSSQVIANMVSERNDFGDQKPTGDVTSLENTKITYLDEYFQGFRAEFSPLEIDKKVVQKMSFTYSNQLPQRRVMKIGERECMSFVMNT